MCTDTKTLVKMFNAASHARAYGLNFMATNEGVTCYAPEGRKDDAERFVQQLKSITVKAVNHVDWPIAKANAPFTNNNDVIALQAALDNAELSSQVLVFANDGIKVNTNGSTLEVYNTLFLLRHTNVTFHEGTFFSH